MQSSGEARRCEDHDSVTCASLGALLPLLHYRYAFHTPALLAHSTHPPARTPDQSEWSAPLGPLHPARPSRPASSGTPLSPLLPAHPSRPALSGTPLPDRNSRPTLRLPSLSLPARHSLHHPPNPPLSTRSFRPALHYPPSLAARGHAPTDKPFLTRTRPSRHARTPGLSSRPAPPGPPFTTHSSRHAPPGLSLLERRSRNAPPGPPLSARPFQRTTLPAHPS